MFCKQTIIVPLTSLLFELVESASASGVQLRSAARFESLFNFIRLIGWQSLEHNYKCVKREEKS